MTAPPSDASASARYRDVFGVTEFRTLFSLQTLLVAGDSVRTIALSVQTYAQTGSSVAAALVFAAGMLPYVVGGALLLSLADRLPVRRLLTGYHVLRFAATALLALGVLPLPAVMALLVAVGLFAPVGGAAVQARLPALLPGDGYVLGRSLFTMTSAGAQITGQAAGGLLLAAITPAAALWLAAASAALAALLARTRLPDVPPAARPASGLPGASGLAGETWRTNRRLLGHRSTRGLLLAAWLPISLSVGAEGVVVPYAAGAGRPDAAGLLLSAAAAGMFAGNFVVGRWIPPATRERLTLPLAMLTGAPLLLFVLEPGLAAACALMAAGTFGLGYELTVQRRFVDAVPEEIRGQALGLSGSGLMTCQAAGIGAAGALGDLLAPGHVMALCGAATIIACLCLARSLR
ncbi:Predicted arabinose efflux permease, MFS family [Actinomadura meyerae]|uniref:Predicted arabinose efflux permease, MFS family n=1 Tax=Actinomadura meyerae TaxID=240840 RepID=A0A239JPM8_9ACTN|nr:MFS transporter [Actinomadura meyerae]SNT07797.1 Predicted arabinose efflux permease, MFS family [Actinomadura meyerae]